MIERRTDPIDELTFLRKLQRLLDEGEFVATYKFALLNALADLSVERSPAPDGSLRLPLTAIAEKFIDYYWSQARPYRGVEETPTVLRQNPGRQAAVINALIERQGAGYSLASVRRDRRWTSLVNRVARIVREMPLWKLQTVGGDADEFLYRRAEFRGGTIRLLPDVPRAFCALHGLVLDAVRGAWIRQIGRIAANRPLLDDADLAAFLFGTERQSLEGYARVLREHQSAACLYCGRAIRGAGEVDHFIAWSRYPADLGHNFVLACRRCNAKKRDYLAYRRHVESWYRTNIERADELAARCDAANLAHDVGRTRAVAWWAYEQGERAGAHAWIRGDEVERLGKEWREVLATPLPRVAEPEPAKYPAD